MRQRRGPLGGREHGPRAVPVPEGAPPGAELARHRRGEGRVGLPEPRPIGRDRLCWLEMHPPALLRRSSNTIEVFALELAAWLGWPPPEEGRGVAVPVGDPGMECGRHLSDGATDAPGEGTLVEELPEPLDQVEPGGGLGQGHEMEAPVTPVPEHGVDGPVQRQAVDDEVDLTRGDERFQPIQEVEPGGGVARGRRLEEDRPGAVVERPVGPAVAVAGVVRAGVWPVRGVGPNAARRVAAGRDRPALV